MSEEKKHLCFPKKQYRWNGIKHIGIKGCFVGKCECGKYLRYESNRVWTGWFETSDKILVKFIDSLEKDDEVK